MTDIADAQYLRQVSIRFGGAGRGIELSGLACQFVVEKSDAEAPNTGTFVIYNLTAETVSRIQQEFKTVLASAGYAANFGEVFHGNIKRTEWGREGTETVLTVEAGDGEEAYNYAVLNTTLAAGSTARKRALTAAQAMELIEPQWVDSGSDTQRGFDAIQAEYVDSETSPTQRGFDAIDAQFEESATRRGLDSIQAEYVDGSLDTLPDRPLPRAKVMYGPARSYLRSEARNADAQWSIQDGKVVVLSNGSFVRGATQRISSRTGMINSPRRTEGGVSVTVLLNPRIAIGHLIEIVEGRETGAAIDAQFDGVYKVIKLTHSGATRGNDWYTEIEAQSVDASAPVGAEVMSAA